MKIRPEKTLLRGSLSFTSLSAVQILGLSVGENSEKTQLTPLLSSGSLVVRFLFVDDIFSVYCLEPLYVLLTLFFTRYSLFDVSLLLFFLALLLPFSVSFLLRF